MNSPKKKKPTEISNRHKQKFIEKYPECGTVGATLKAIGIKWRKTFYKWCEADPGFKEFYQTELLPARRDELASLMYRYAAGKLGTYTKTYTNKKGESWTEETPVQICDTQVRCMFGFLKATDHIENPEAPDRLAFCEKNQVELSNKDGEPLKVEHDVKNKLVSLLNRYAARAGEAGSGPESQS